MHDPIKVVSDFDGVEGGMSEKINKIFRVYGMEKW
jgi:hypothetical protein